jgi:hypothetical protein
VDAVCQELTPKMTLTNFARAVLYTGALFTAIEYGQNWRKLASDIYLSNKLYAGFINPNNNISVYNYDLTSQIFLNKLSAC